MKIVSCESVCECVCVKKKKVIASSQQISLILLNIKYIIFTLKYSSFLLRKRTHPHSRTEQIWWWWLRKYFSFAAFVVLLLFNTLTPSDSPFELWLWLIGEDIKFKSDLWVGFCENYNFFSRFFFCLLSKK